MQFPTIPQPPQIDFDAEDVAFPLTDAEAVRRWLLSVIAGEGGQPGPISFVFCSDAFLHQLNIAYLQHDTLTDIITFPFADPPTVHGEIYISTERVAENAAKYGVSFGEELCRVMVHGILHLLGYGDKTPAQKRKMRDKESEWLERYAGPWPESQPADGH